MIDLEIQNISKYIKSGDKVLDVGCANGYSTFSHLNMVSEIYGIDFSENMISEACKRQGEIELSDKAHFSEGDIREIMFDNEEFDMVYTTRVLINLSNWEEQIKGIEECLRVVKPGGLVILSEGFWEPLVLLNSIRSLTKLTPLYEHDFNRYLKKTKLEDYLNLKGLEFEVVDFSSIYYLGSRFLRELVTNPKDYPGFSNPINKIFFDVQQQFSGGGFGIQQIYAIKK